LFEERIHYFLAVPEISILETSEGIGKIDEAVASGETKYAQRACNFEPFVERNAGALSFVDQYQVSVKIQRKCYGSSRPAQSGRNAEYSSVSTAFTSTQLGRCATHSRITLGAAEWLSSRYTAKGARILPNSLGRRSMWCMDNK